MTPLVLAILSASLLGSFHCAGMCGAFLAVAVSPTLHGVASPRSPHTSHLRLQAAYHLGRLATYSIFGAIAGSLGSAVNFLGDMAGVQRMAMLIAAAFMTGYGLVLLARALGITLPRLPLPGGFVSVISRAQRSVLDLKPIPRATLIGLLTTLLPCGWLYAFVIAAGGTGHPLPAMLAMFAFWLGTLPLMAALGAGARTLLGPLSRRLPVATALVLVIMGLLTLTGRVTALGNLPAALATMVQATPQAAVERASQMNQEQELPCCRDAQH